MSEDTKPPDNAYWLSWEHEPDRMGAFELHSPWWVSGETIEGYTKTICAAVRAPSVDAAWDLIAESYDKCPGAIPIRFCQRKGDDWSPYSERFPRAEWMQW